MIITLVIDQYGEDNNGTTMTCRRLSEVLRQHGHKVRILAGECAGEEELYETGYTKLPIVYQVCRSQGMVLAKAKQKVIEAACDGADIVHFLLPFKLAKKTKKYCDKKGIPTMAAFHCQPENITSTIHLGKSKWANDYIYRRFRKFYNQFSDVHTPSQMMADQLIKHNYKSNIHVISNGVSSFFKYVETEKPDSLKDKFIILMIGRYSIEKRQDLIIEAVKKSPYEKNIQIILAGKGPWKNKLEELSRGLTNQVIFGFYKPEELLKVINYSDLYIHASDAESEAISCIEAFSCGKVPIISDSPLVATNQFALDNHCLFKNGDSDSLEKQIRFFYENESFKNDLSKRYIEYGKEFQLEHCVSKLEAIFQEVINKKRK